MPAIIVIMLIVVVASLAWHHYRAGELLQNWATMNGYQIVEHERRSLFRGPFFWSSSKNQVIYRVTVRDRRGNTRQGWVRCGGWWWGMLSDSTEVRWDEEG